MVLAEADAPHDLESLLSGAEVDAERASVAQRASRQLTLLTGTLVVLFAGIAATTVALSPLLSSTVSVGRAVLPRLLGAP